MSDQNNAQAQDSYRLAAMQFQPTGQQGMFPGGYQPSPQYQPAYQSWAPATHQQDYQQAPQGTHTEVIYVMEQPEIREDIFCVNIDAPRGSKQRALALISLFFATLIFLFGLLFTIIFASSFIPA
eukprot:TRINITY_DN509_c0_g1_i1.p1 TRINITY_DN509_c0_g1~~TRINITY_DN509_c0_g1_i1.p1  ORF type:complete len:125 (+),score=32.35 TRINITY_DN509_c0_g1_i1:599-973(+)